MPDGVASNDTTGGTSTSTNTLTNSGNTAYAPDLAVQTNSGLTVGNNTGTINTSDEGAIAAAFAFASNALSTTGTAVQQALTGESQIASGALQFSSGLATQGANLAGQSNVGGALKQLIVPILIAIAVILVAYFIFK